MSAGDSALAEPQVSDRLQGHQGRLDVKGKSVLRKFNAERSRTKIDSLSHLIESVRQLRKIVRREQTPSCEF